MRTPLTHGLHHSDYVLDYNALYKCFNNLFCNSFGDIRGTPELMRHCYYPRAAIPDTELSELISDKRFDTDAHIGNYEQDILKFTLCMDGIPFLVLVGRIGFGKSTIITNTLQYVILNILTCANI